VLTTLAFPQPADVPPALTSFAKIDNPQTRRAYQNDVEEFMCYAGITDPPAFRDVARAHVLAWRRNLELCALGGATIRRKLAALSSLFKSLCEANAIQGNPVDGAKRPKNESTEYKTLAIADHQARAAGGARRVDAARAARPRHPGHPALSRPAPRRTVCAAPDRPAGALRRTQSVRAPQGQQNPVCSAAPSRGWRDCAVPGSGWPWRREGSAPLSTVSNNTRGAGRAITPSGVYQMLAKYAAGAGIEIDCFGPHALRATAASNALEHDAHFAKVPQWLGHSNCSDSWDHVPIRSWPLFKARRVLRTLLTTGKPLLNS
jgi:integrase/recombinase XerD